MTREPEPIECASPPCFLGEAAASCDEVCVLVLAGGEGRRIGGAKPQRLLDGRPLLEHALLRANEFGWPVAIAIRGQAWRDLAPHRERVIDREDLEGPLAGLASGLAWARWRGAQRLLAIPCDAPFLPPDLGARLLGASLEAGAAAAVPIAQGRAHPACALWRTDLGEALDAYAASGRRALQGFAEHVGALCVDFSHAPSNAFLNVNTPEDLLRAQSLLRPLPAGRADHAAQATP